MTTPIRSVLKSSYEGLRIDTPGRQPAVFLDRDGVLNSGESYVRTPDELDAQLMPSSLAALAVLRRAGIPTVLVTNQGGVGAGVTSPEMNHAILERLSQRVDEAGGHLDAIYYCPTPGAATPVPLQPGEVSGRKPGPGMLFQAAWDLGPAVDLADSYMIGDRITDLQAGDGATFQMNTVLVETGFGGQDGTPACPPDYQARDLGEAVRWILRREDALAMYS